MSHRLPNTFGLNPNPLGSNPANPANTPDISPERDPNSAWFGRVGKSLGEGWRGPEFVEIEQIILDADGDETDNPNPPVGKRIRLEGEQAKKARESVKGVGGKWSGSEPVEVRFVGGSKKVETVIPWDGQVRSRVG